jgi:aryl-alcohol dehydrogenase-like predicted oxidoreductase
MTTTTTATTVPTVTLASGLVYPQVSFGTGKIFERVPFERAVTLLRGAHAAGVRAFDVGNYNGMPGVPGIAHADVLFRAVIAEAGIARDDYLHVQKIWNWHYPLESYADQLRRHLDRVGVERADVGVLGSLYDRPIPTAELVEQIGGLVEAGLLGAWAINNWPPAQAAAVIAEADRQGVRRPEFVQLAYNVARRSIAEGRPYQQVLAGTGLAVQASVVFQSGLLLGQGEDRAWGSRDVVLDRVAQSAGAFAAAAEGLGASRAALALAFVLTNPAPRALALIGFSTLAQLDDALGAFDLLERAGAAAVRDAVADLWLDRDVTDPHRGVHSDPAPLLEPAPVAETV